MIEIVRSKYSKSYYSVLDKSNNKRIGPLTKSDLLRIVAEIAITLCGEEETIKE